MDFRRGRHRHDRHHLLCPGTAWGCCLCGTAGNRQGPVAGG
ncbi:UNVERIFIED_CONTAM: hypothetical protein GTU68_020870 [Idotea baltica]|nr:hypothetical protein [Idotea baltica]